MNSIKTMFGKRKICDNKVNLKELKQMEFHKKSSPYLKRFYNKLIFLIFVFLIYSTASFAGIASRPFHFVDRGYTFVDWGYTLNPRTDFERGTVGLDWFSGSGNTEYNGTPAGFDNIPKFDFNFNGFRLNGSIKLQTGLIGFGYSNITIDNESNNFENSSGYKLSIENKETNIDTGYLHIQPKYNFLIRIIKNTYEVERTASLKSGWTFSSNGSRTISESSKLESMKFEVGGLYKIDYNISIGAIFSPAHGEKKKLEKFSDTEVRYGEGNQLKTGFGYNTDQLSTGFDFVYSEENKEYRKNAYNSYQLNVYYLILSNFSLDGNLGYTQTKKLTDGTTVDPSSTGNQFGIGGSYGSEKFSFGLKVFQFSTSYSANEKGDPKKSSFNGFMLSGEIKF